MSTFIIFQVSRHPKHIQYRKFGIFRLPVRPGKSQTRKGLLWPNKGSRVNFYVLKRFLISSAVGLAPRFAEKSGAKRHFWAKTADSSYPRCS